MSTTSTSAQVPKLRFPGFEDPWQRKPLGAVGEFKNGLNKGKEDFGFGHPFVNLMDVFGRATLSSASFGLVNATDADLQACDLTAGDVLFIRSSVKREGVGEAILVAEDLPNTVYSGFLIRFREHGSTLAPGFKRHGFGVPQFRQQVLSLATTSANTNINQDSLEQIEVSYPTKAEQQKIAAFLTAVDGRIEQLSRKKALLEAYKKGVMQQLFTQTLRFQDDHGHDFPAWEEKTLGDVVELLSGQHLGPEDYNEDERGVPYFTGPSDFASDPVSFTKWTTQNTKIAGSDSVLITVKGNGVGRVMYSTLDQVALGRQLMALRSSSCDNRFLYQFLLTKAQEFVALGSGNLIPGLSRGDILTMALPCPSLPEQTKIAGFLSALDGKIGAVGEQMRQTQAWKKGLLQQMFV